MARKPRFTADPPIALEGMAPEEKIDAIVDWMQRQVYRIDDWWPEDFSARLDLLEALFPGIPGVWPIVDYSYVRFLPEAREVYAPEAMVWARIFGTVIYASDTDYSSFSEVAHPSEANLFRIADNGLGRVAGIFDQSKVGYSDDVENWTFKTLPAALQVNTFTGNILWDAPNDRWLIVRQNTTFLGLICYSADLDFDNFTLEAQISSGAAVEHTCTDGAGNYLALANTGTTGSAYYSSDSGASWTHFTFAGINSYWQACEYGNGRWVAVGGRGQKWWSTTHTGSFTLAERTSTTSEICRDVHYANGKFIVRQNYGSGLRYSADGGTSWTDCSVTGYSVGVATQGDSLSYESSFGWVCASDGKLKSSTDGITWSDHTSPNTSLTGAHVFSKRI